MSLDELRAKRKELDEKSEKSLAKMNEIIQEGYRVENIAANADEIIDNIDKEFEKATSLGNADIGFLLFATMLQSLRWIIMKDLSLPNMEEMELSVAKEERLRANERNHKGGVYDGKSSGAEYEHEASAKYIENHKQIAEQSEDEFYGKKNQYRSWIEIITQPVPYDALNGLDKKLVPNIADLNKQNPNGTYNNIFGNNHHVATLGHDPVLGWVFGTANIMTSTISFVDFQSFKVLRGHKIKSLGEFALNNELQYSDQAIDYSDPSSLIEILYECCLSTKEDYRRIAAAVAKQAMHLASDKYCIEGLPIPILSVIDPQKAQEMIERGWNSIEFEKLLQMDLRQIGISAGLSMLINLVVEAVYMLCMDLDMDSKLKRVKINKILSISGTIASSSNLLYMALSDKESKADVGGIGVAMLELLHSAKFIKDLKQEYIRNNFEKMIMCGEEY